MQQKIHWIERRTVAQKSFRPHMNVGLHPMDVVLWVETLDGGTMDLHSQLPTMETWAKEVKFWMKKLKVRANELKLNLGNATPKFCITLRISEIKAEATKLDLTNVLKEMKSIELWVIEVKTKAIMFENKLKA